MWLCLVQVVAWQPSVELLIYLRLLCDFEGKHPPKVKIIMVIFGECWKEMKCIQSECKILRSVIVLTWAIPSRQICSSVKLSEIILKVSRSVERFWHQALRKWLWKTCYECCYGRNNWWSISKNWRKMTTKSGWSSGLCNRVARSWRSFCFSTFGLFVGVFIL